jgi:hypothetical protein
MASPPGHPIVAAALGLGLVCLGGAITSTSQTRDQMLDDSIVLAGRSIGVFRETIGNYLSASERDLERSIQYHAAPNWGINARAIKTPTGQRQIELGTGLYFYLGEISLAQFSYRWGVAPQCFDNYVDLVVRATQRNSDVSSPRQARLGVPPFSNYTLTIPSCGALSLNAWKGDEQGQELQQASDGVSVRWVLAHELAHHLKGHVERSATTLEASRMNEIEADRFAFQIITADDPGMILLAFPAYLLIADFSCAREDEATSSHPSAERRIGILADALRGLAQSDSFMQRLKDPSKRDDIRARLLKLAEALTKAWSSR